MRVTLYRRVPGQVTWHYHPACAGWPDGKDLPADPELGLGGEAAPPFEETTIKPASGIFCSRCRAHWLSSGPPPPQEGQPPHAQQ